MQGKNEEILKQRDGLPCGYPSSSSLGLSFSSSSLRKNHIMGKIAIWRSDLGYCTEDNKHILLSFLIRFCIILGRESLIRMQAMDECKQVTISAQFDLQYLNQLEQVAPIEISYTPVRQFLNNRLGITILDACQSGRIPTLICYAEHFLETEFSQMSLLPPRYSLGIQTSYEISYKEEVKILSDEISKRIFDVYCQRMLGKDPSCLVLIDGADILSEAELKKHLRVRTRQAVQAWYRNHRILYKRRTSSTLHLSLAKKRQRLRNWPRSSISRKSSKSSDSLIAAKIYSTVFAVVKEYEEFYARTNRTRTNSLTRTNSPI